MLLVDIIKKKIVPQISGLEHLKRLFITQKNGNYISMICFARKEMAKSLVHCYIPLKEKFKISFIF